jgi:hypothetical protein
MVYFPFAARTAFFATLLLHVPTSSDGFVLLKSSSSSLWGVVLPSKKPLYQQLQTPTSSSYSSKHFLEATGSPHPPDTPPPPLFFAQPEGEDDEYEYEYKQEDDTEKSASSSMPTTSTATTTATTATNDLLLSSFTKEELEEFKRFSQEWSNKAVEFVIVSVLNA